MQKIAVIEDERHINDLIVYNLRKEGFLVDQIFHGEIAQQKLRKSIYDIVLLDIMLPGIDGFSLCREIRSRQEASKTAVVMVSAKYEHVDKIYAYLLGADCYITKPFSVKELLDIVRDLYNLRQRDFSVHVH